jgi:hypothetical protein
MTRLYAAIAAVGAFIAALFMAKKSGAKKARSDAKTASAIAGAETRERIADATQRHAGDSDDAIRRRLHTRRTDTP